MGLGWPLDAALLPLPGGRVRLALARIHDGAQMRVRGLELVVDLDELEDLGRGFTEYAASARKGAAGETKWRTGTRATPPPSHGGARSVKK